MLKSRSGGELASMASCAAEGWSLQRVTWPSRLYGANGIRAGADGRIYVAQVAGSQVSAIDPDTGVIEVICPTGGAVTGPDDLVFDEHGNLYVTELTEDQVRVVHRDGTSKVVQGGMKAANPITYHQGRLIAGELNMAGRILELDRAGGAPRVIVDQVPMVNAFEVGPDGKLYFPAQGANEIWRVDLDGKNLEVVTRDLGVPDSVKFHPDGYIVSTQVHSGQVLRIDPQTGEKSVLAQLSPGLDNVTFIGRRTFVSHGGGSLFELLEHGGTRPLVEGGLQWPLGLAVNRDGELFIADGVHGFGVDPETGEAPHVLGGLFTPGFPGWVRGVADAGGGEWFVTTANGDLARWSPGSQEHVVLAGGFDRLMDIAVLHQGEIVFTEYGTGKVWSLAGGNSFELASGLDGPKGVTTDGSAVFVAESGAGRVVQLCGTSSCPVIEDLVEPQGIIAVNDRLYVVDVGAKEVVEVELATGARRTIARNLPVGAPPGVVHKQLSGVNGFCGPMTTMSGIASYGGSLYVSADAEGSVLSLTPAAR